MTKRKQNIDTDQPVSSKQLSGEDQPVILVGGGTILVNPDKSDTLKGASEVICPPYYQVIQMISSTLTGKKLYVTNALSGWLCNANFDWMVI